MVKLSSDPLSWLTCALFFAAAPLLTGIIDKVKARLSGRFGPTVWQPYYELLRLARKEIVYSTSAGFISRVAPVLVWCTVAFASLLLPLGRPAAVSFPGDIILFAYLLALGRFFPILAAVDVASSLAGMGARREARVPHGREEGPQPRAVGLIFWRGHLLFPHRQLRDRHAAFLVGYDLRC